MTRFLAVYEDLWGNKESWFASIGNLGDILVELAKRNGIHKLLDIDVDKYNSEFPYDAGVVSYGFYDIEVYDDVEEEHIGRIMIFSFEDEDYV